MESLKKLEVTVASWYKDMPHLPTHVQRWLADNIWWIILIGLGLTILSVIGLISLTFFAGAVLVGVAGAAGAVVGGLAFLAVMATLISSLIFIVVASMAITPLKAKQEKGWLLLFLLLLIEAVSLVAFLLSYDLFGFLWGVLLVGVGGYFLFEIRGHYAATHRTKKV